MKFENSIFYTGNDKYDNAKKNTKLFPFLNNDLEFVDSLLRQINIGKVMMFDEISPNWIDWGFNDKLTLVVLPLCNIVNQNGVKTKDYVSSIIGYNNDYSCVDIFTDEYNIDKGTVHYFSTRNLVICNCNPFVNGDIFNLVYDNLCSCGLKFLNEQDIIDEKLGVIWKESIDSSIRIAKNDFRSIRNNIEDIKNQYHGDVKRLAESEHRISSLIKRKDGLNDFISNELKLCKNLPIVKEIIIRDKIYVSFGDIYINDKVRIGVKNVDGIDVPDIRKEKVYIGNLKFVIGVGEVKVLNDSQVGSYQHPHAVDNRICFGSADLKISKLLAELKLKELLMVLYSWAISYNDEDAHTKLQTFYDKRVSHDDDEIF